MPKIRPTRVKLVPFLAACTRKLKEVISNKEIKGSYIQSNVHRSFVSSVFLWTIFIIIIYLSWEERSEDGEVGGSTEVTDGHHEEEDLLLSRYLTQGEGLRWAVRSPLFHLLDLGILRAGDRHLVIPTPLHAGVQRGFGVTVRTVHGVIGPGRWSPAPSIFVS